MTWGSYTRKIPNTPGFKSTAFIHYFPKSQGRSLCRGVSFDPPSCKWQARKPYQQNCPSCKQLFDILKPKDLVLLILKKEQTNG